MQRNCYLYVIAAKLWAKSWFKALFFWVLGLASLPLVHKFHEFFTDLMSPNHSFLYFGGDSSNEYKLVLCVRSDLGMGKGKVAAQCSHAAVGALLDLQNIESKCQGENKGNSILNTWLSSGQRKVVVKVNDHDELESLRKNAITAGLNAHVVCDAGRTQIPAGSITVLAVGPGPEKLVNTVTGHLKLL